MQSNCRRPHTPDYFFFWNAPDRRGMSRRQFYARVAPKTTLWEDRICPEDPERDFMLRLLRAEARDVQQEKAFQALVKALLGATVTVSDDEVSFWTPEGEPLRAAGPRADARPPHSQGPGWRSWSGWRGGALLPPQPPRGSQPLLLHAPHGQPLRWWPLPPPFL